MNQNPFVDVIRFLELSADECSDTVATLDAVNQRFRDALRPGTFLLLYESMIKSFHHDFKGKIKTIHKIHSIGYEIKKCVRCLKKCCGSLGAI